MKASPRYFVRSAACALALALCITPITQAEPKLSGMWFPQIELGGQLFPSMIISTATLKRDVPIDDDENSTVLGDVMGLIGARVVAPRDKTSVVVEVRSDTVMEPSRIETEMAYAGEEYHVYPKIAWKFDRLLDVRQRMPVNVTIRVSIDGGPASERVETLDLRSINDCPWFIPPEPTFEEAADPQEPDPQEPDPQQANPEPDTTADTAADTDVDTGVDTGTDISFLFAAFVNEDHPIVDQILKEALSARIVDSFLGYQAQDPQIVNQQVYAIWHALHKRGIRYSSITDSAGKNDVVYAQHVRFIDQSIDNQQANCVDGSVLFASLLRKIGLNVQLACVPGHMYVTYALDPEGTTWVGMETTVLGSGQSGRDVVNDLTLDDPKSMEATARTISEATFGQAIEIATKELSDHMKDFEGANPEYQLIDVGAARAMGIIPIAYRPGR